MHQGRGAAAPHPPMVWSPRSEVRSVAFQRCSLCLGLACCFPAPRRAAPVYLLAFEHIFNYLATELHNSPNSHPTRMDSFLSSPSHSTLDTHTIALLCIALHTCIALRCVVLHRITSHGITSDAIALHWTAPHYIALHFTELHCTESHQIVWHCATCHYIFQRTGDQET